jgi:signal recognition particle subunit SRP68
LEEYIEDPGLTSKRPNLVKFPPDFEPIPAKPLFFDLALSLVQFPSLEDKLEQKQQAGGLTGYFKGWLWGGKK